MWPRNPVQLVGNERSSICVLLHQNPHDNTEVRPQPAYDKNDSWLMYVQPTKGVPRIGYDVSERGYSQLHAAYPTEIGSTTRFD